MVVVTGKNKKETSMVLRGKPSLFQGVAEKTESGRGHLAPKKKRNVPPGKEGGWVLWRG